MKKVFALCLIALFVWLPLSAAATELDQVPEAFRFRAGGSDVPAALVEPDPTPLAPEVEPDVDQLLAKIAEMEAMLAALEAGQPTPAPVEAEPTLSGELFDYQVKLDGVVYALPFSFDALYENGWRFSDPLEREQMIYPDQYRYVSLKRRDPFDPRTMTAYFLNEGVDAVPCAGCPVAGFQIELYEEDVTAAENDGTPLTGLTLAGGVVLFRSTSGDVAAAYGPATREDTYGEITEWVYEQDYYNNFSFRFGPSGLLIGVTAWHFVKPDLSHAAVSQEPPASNADYVAPAEMGGIRSLVFEVGGDLYRLPAPISAFESNGWRAVDLEYSEPILLSHQSGYLSMERGDDRIAVGIVNLEDTAVQVLHARVNSAYVYSEGDPLGAMLALPGGIRVGSSYDAVLDAYGDWISYVSQYGDETSISIYIGDVLSLSLTLNSGTMTVTGWSFDVKALAGLDGK